MSGFPTKVSITSQQNAVTRDNLLDLASGYPLLRANPALVETLETVASGVRQVFQHPDVGTRTTYNNRSYDRLISSIRSVLSFPEGGRRFVQCALTGSFAIDRVLSALISYAQNHGKAKVHIVGPSPAFDLPHLAIVDKKMVTFETVAVLQRSRTSMIDALIGAADSVGSGNQAVIFLSSPENPTGVVLTQAELARISTACAERDWVLVVDHCFLQAGVQQPGSVTPIWTVAKKTKFIAVWDTGKLVSLDGHKLGFVLTNCDELDACLKIAIEVLQVQLPVFDVAFFALFCGSKLFFDEVARLHGTCQQNVQWIRSNSKALAQNFVSPAGGTVALVDISASGLTDEQFRSRLAKKGVGVLAASAFFWSEPIDRRFIRISLARDTDYFAKAASVLEELMLEM